MFQFVKLWRLLICVYLYVINIKFKCIVLHWYLIFVIWSDVLHSGLLLELDDALVLLKQPPDTQQHY